MFKLSNRSLRNLEGVDQRLVDVIKETIKRTPCDFVCIEGVRTVERQKILVAEGKSQTMNSMHILGKAVDILALPTKAGSWDVKDYYPIIDVVAQVAHEMDVEIKWGGNWMRPLKHTIGAQSTHEEYLDYKAASGQTPFTDAPHLELVV